MGQQLTFLNRQAPCRKLTDTQGAMANHAGKTAEAAIYCLFKERGYQIERQKKVGTSIYGTTLFADFFIHWLPGFPNGLVVESKWQSAGGSVDEKYPYIVANIKAGRYLAPVIVVLDGGGYKDGAAKWLRGQVDGQKLVAVYDFKELIQWTIEAL